MRKLVLVSVGLAMCAALSACTHHSGQSGFSRERGKGDAPVSAAYWHPVNVYETPNGYGDFTEVCDTYRNLVILASQRAESTAPYIVVFQHDYQDCPVAPRPNWVNPNAAQQERSGGSNFSLLGNGGIH